MLIEMFWQAIPFSKFNNNILSTRLGVKRIDIKSFASLQEYQARIVAVLQKYEGSNALPSTKAIVHVVDNHDLGPLTQMLGRINFSVNSQVRLIFAT